MHIYKVTFVKIKLNHANSGRYPSWRAALPIKNIWVPYLCPNQGCHRSKGTGDSRWIVKQVLSTWLDGYCYTHDEYLRYRIDAWNHFFSLCTAEYYPELWIKPLIICNLILYSNFFLMFSARNPTVFVVSFQTSIFQIIANFGTAYIILENWFVVNLWRDAICSQYDKSNNKTASQISVDIKKIRSSGLSFRRSCYFQ